MIRYAARGRVSPEDLARDRAFWADLLDLRARSGLLPAHTGAGYGNRRFAIIRHAAWITLYRAVHPYPQIGAFLRCSGPAGDAFFTLADRARDRIEDRLRADVGTGAVLEWGSSHHPGMTDIAAIIAAPFPWDDAAAGLHMAWLLQAGGAWWKVFASLGEL